MADLLIDEKIIVELKAVTNLIDEHYAQLMNYLFATKIPVGYLLNFGYENGLEWKRINISEKLSKLNQK